MTTPVITAAKTGQYGDLEEGLDDNRHVDPVLSGRAAPGAILKITGSGFGASNGSGGPTGPAEAVFTFGDVTLTDTWVQNSGTAWARIPTDTRPSKGALTVTVGIDTASLPFEVLVAGPWISSPSRTAISRIPNPNLGGLGRGYSHSIGASVDTSPGGDHPGASWAAACAALAGKTYAERDTILGGVAGAYGYPLHVSGVVDGLPTYDAWTIQATVLATIDPPMFPYLLPQTLAGPDGPTSLDGTIPPVLPNGAIGVQRRWEIDLHPDFFNITPIPIEYGLANSVITAILEWHFDTDSQEDGTLDVRVVRGRIFPAVGDPAFSRPFDPTAYDALGTSPVQDAVGPWRDTGPVSLTVSDGLRVSDYGMLGRTSTGDFSSACEGLESTGTDTNDNVAVSRGPTSDLIYIEQVGLCGRFATADYVGAVVPFPPGATGIEWEISDGDFAALPTSEQFDSLSIDLAVYANPGYPDGAFGGPYEETLQLRPTPEVYSGDPGYPVANVFVPGAALASRPLIGQVDLPAELATYHVTGDVPLSYLATDDFGPYFVATAHYERQVTHAVPDMGTSAARLGAGMVITAVGTSRRYRYRYEGSTDGAGELPAAVITGGDLYNPNWDCLALYCGLANVVSGTGPESNTDVRTQVLLPARGASTNTLTYRVTYRPVDYRLLYPAPPPLLDAYPTGAVPLAGEVSYKRTK